MGAGASSSVTTTSTQVQGKADSSTAPGLEAKFKDPASIAWENPDDVFKRYLTFIGKDESSSITREELSEALQRTGYSEETCTTLMAELDSDKDGVISLEECVPTRSVEPASQQKAPSRC